MKTFYILTAILGLQFNMLVASNLTSGSNLSNKEINLTDLSALAPGTPREADFSDVAPESSNNYNHLAPANPKVASFEEPAQLNESGNLMNLAPELPSEADFNDSESTLPNINLTPVTPVEADFEDLV